MNPDTGEIKSFDEKKIPKGWHGLPMDGEEVVLTYKMKLPGGAGRTFHSRWRVVGVEPGNPGRMTIEALPRKG